MEALLAHCSTVFQQHEPVLLALFLGGLTGGFTHCLAMCGPFVSCQSACGSCSNNLSLVICLPYHLGRMLTYGALGFCAALLSKQITTMPHWEWLSAGLLVTAGLMFIISSLPHCKHFLFRFNHHSLFIRGILMGFMPCGLLYAALMMATTLADPISGMIGMWLFVLGTLPPLMLVGVGTDFATRQWREVMVTAGRVVMAVNGFSLLYIAEEMVRY